MSYRCGIKTCRKCRLFEYYVRQKQLCIWDENYDGKSITADETAGDGLEGNDQAAGVAAAGAGAEGGAEPDEKVMKNVDEQNDVEKPQPL